VGTLLVELVLLGLLAGVAALVLPRLTSQITALADGLPGYLTSLTEWVAGVLGTDAQTVRDRLTDASGSVERLLPTAQAVLSRIGGYTLTLLTGPILVIAVLSMTTYAVVNPKPLLRGYLRLFPSRLQDRPPGHTPGVRRWSARGCGPPRWPAWSKPSRSCCSCR
jgi:putative permease